MHRVTEEEESINKSGIDIFFSFRRRNIIHRESINKGFLFNPQIKENMIKIKEMVFIFS